jgi:hypothetical protein
MADGQDSDGVGLGPRGASCNAILVQPGDVHL